VFACTHTGLPYAQDLTDHQGRRRLVINNGSAGLANFTGTTFGVITHLSSSPNRPPTASMASASTGCAVTPWRWRSTSTGGGHALWRNGPRQSRL